MDPYGKKSMRFKGIEFGRAHAITIDHADNVWLVDDIANTITKCDKFGTRLMMLLPPRDDAESACVLVDPSEMKAAAGRVHAPAPKHSGRRFNRPTDVAIHPRTGDIFVSDGYGNSCVHRLRADGTHLKTWGRPGTGPGELQ